MALAEYASGAGRVMIGSMTAVEFQEPEDAAKSLRINVLSYLLGKPAPPPSPSPPPPPPDTTKPTVTIKGLPKSCVKGGFRFRVNVSDAGGVGVVRVKLGGKLLRKADGKGLTSKLVKVRVPDKNSTTRAATASGPSLATLRAMSPANRPRSGSAASASSSRTGGGHHATPA